MPAGARDGAAVATDAVALAVDNGGVEGAGAGVAVALAVGRVLVSAVVGADVPSAEAAPPVDGALVLITTNGEISGTILNMFIVTANPWHALVSVMSASTLRNETETVYKFQDAAR